MTLTTFSPHRLLTGQNLTELVPGQIVNIGGSKLDANLKEWLEVKLFGLYGHQLVKEDGSTQRLLPSPMLSDDAGLAHWRHVNRLPDYYQTCDEIELFEKYGKDISKLIPDGASIIDLGSGDTRKIKPLLDFLEASQKEIRYFALDISQTSIKRGLKELLPGKKHVKCFGLWGLFSEGLEVLHCIPSPRWICSLGSSLGNDWYESSVAHLHRWADQMNADDRILLGMDACKDKDALWKSYHDPDGVFEAFMRNGLQHVNHILGEQWYRPEDWYLEGVWHQNPTMHYFRYTAKRDVFCALLGVTLVKGTQIDCYEAFKYDVPEMKAQFHASGFELTSTWRSPSARIWQYLLRPTSKNIS